MARVAASIAVLVSLVFGAATAHAVELEPLGDGTDPFVFSRPTSIVSAPDDPDRIFVASQGGTVHEISEGKLRYVADLTSLVKTNPGEQGLLSIAPAPDFAATERFYAAYSGVAATAGGADGDIHLDAFVPVGEGAETEAEVERTEILTIPHPNRENHYAGQIQFGPDGYLYLSTGDGGGTGDPDGNAQNLGVLLGKILRIQPFPEAEEGDPTYAVPLDNPFVGTAGARPEIWAYGFRNPWRFSFDRATGDLVIGDVGQGEFEEIDVARAPDRGKGDNFGWNVCEGEVLYSPVLEPEGGFPPCPEGEGFVRPAFTYPHSDAEDGSAHGCSITGGYVVRDPGLGDLWGRYVYADYCVGDIRSISPRTFPRDRSEEIDASINPTTFGEDACGRIYVADYGGRIFRFVGDDGPACQERPPPTLPPSPPAAGAESKPPPPPEQARTVSLRAKRAGKRLKLTVAVSPCGGSGGAVVQIERGGSRLRAKPLPPACLARFNFGRRDFGSYRALLVEANGALVPSQRVRLVSPPRR